MKNLTLFVVLILFVSCQKTKQFENHDYELVAAQDLNFDIVFPRPLMDLIKASATPGFNMNRSPYEIFQPLPVNVKVTQEHGNALDGKNYQFDFRDFGGQIDWNAYLKRSGGGGINVQFDFPDAPSSEYKVFFLSWTKIVKQNDEIFGNGCRVILDVTSFFKSTVFKTGLRIHTKDFRYFYATVGRFYFIFYNKDKISLSQVTFTDSSLAEKMCEEAL